MCHISVNYHLNDFLELGDTLGETKSGVELDKEIGLINWLRYIHHHQLASP